MVKETQDAEATQARLPPYFPLVDRKKKCNAVAQPFFSCFSENGMLSNPVSFSFNLM